MSDKKTKNETGGEVAKNTETTIISYKGFDANLQCRGFQFEIGSTYEHKGDVAACSSGFHACENPMDVFGYYGPGESRYALVRQDGKISRHDGDSKIASARITIEAEIKLPDFIKAAIKYVFDAATLKNGVTTVDGEREAVAVKGYSSAASATGYSSAASATGYSSAAMASGANGKVSWIKGCALFLVYRDPNTWDILHAWAGVVGNDGIKPDTFYTLGSDGKPVEAGQ